MHRRMLCFLLAIGLVLGSAKAEEDRVTYAATGAWVAYWDARLGAEEAVQNAQGLDALVLFAAFFDTKDKLFIPEDLYAAKDTVVERVPEAQQPVIYLSIVNDKMLADGQYAQKDAALLYRLLATPKARAAHIKDILRVAQEIECDGIEIDYERLDSDMVLWAHFLSFIEELYEAASALDMPLRILLQPNAPTDMLRFPVGCEYVMMCYNLFGTHSGPGPKADAAFLRDMAAKMAYVPAPRRFALATGGFDWADAGVRQVTYMQAEDTLAKKKVAERDEASGALYYRYKDAQSAEHTVWYADDHTLAYWMHVLGEQGETAFDLWRLGGNR